MGRRFYNMELAPATVPPAGTQAVDRAAELLALVVESPDPRTFTSLVEQTGLAKSTGSRLLQALERHRLVQRDRDGVWSICCPALAPAVERLVNLVLAAPSTKEAT
jgi:DNA-binding IclR family transcriptional regulator